jgi:Reverse transcriptase (RNA-dependent DNA polymerase)
MGVADNLKLFILNYWDFSNGTNDLENIEPPSYTEAMKSSNAEKWIQACQDEYENLLGYGTWPLVRRPTDTNTVRNRWVFHVKRGNLSHIDKYKAQLVAQGFSQIPGIDFNETYSPTI